MNTPVPGTPGGPPLLLFDGVCTLCNSTVDFILRWESGPVLHFAPLQSAAAAEALATAQSGEPNLDTVLLIQDGQVHERSAAVLVLSRYLKWPFRALAWLVIVPRFIRDAAYRMIAASRYRIFGKRESCRMPDPGLRARMHDDGFGAE